MTMHKMCPHLWNGGMYKNYRDTEKQKRRLTTNWKVKEKTIIRRLKSKKQSRFNYEQ